MSVSKLTVNDLVDKAIEEAPDQQDQELSKKAFSSNKILELADELDKLAEKTSSEEEFSLKQFKDSESEKKAALDTIFSTYIELETK